MKNAFIGIVIILALLFSISDGFSQDFENLIVAPEVLVGGAAPEGLMFKPGRILDKNTIWFCGVNGLYQYTLVFRSIDGGKTFTCNETPISGRAAQMDAFDALTAVVATAEGDIFKTDDGGATWSEVYTYTISPTVAGWFDGCRVVDEGVAIAYGDFEPNGNMHFVRTTDYGDTWTEIEGIDYLNAAYGYYTWGSAACNVGQSIWCSATTMDYDSTYVFRSDDAGLNWDSFQIPNEVIPNYPRSIAFSDMDNGMIAARGGYLIKTMDGGATWSSTSNPDTSTSSYPNAVIGITGTDIIVAMDDIGCYYTTDLGETWGEIAKPEEADEDNFVGGVFLNEDFGYVFTYNGLVLRFENQIKGAPEFDNLIVAPEVLVGGAAPEGLMFKPGRILDKNTIWFCGVNGLYEYTLVFRSIDGGKTFTYNETPISGRAAQMDAFDALTAVVATAEGDIFKTDDGGATWSEVYTYTISPTVAGWFDGCRVVGEGVAIAYGDFEPNGNMQFVRTEDYGDSWTEIEGIDFLNAAYGYYTWGLASCTVGQSIWCSATTMDYDSSYVFRSYDAGENWDSFQIPNEVIPNYPRAIAFSDDNNGLIAARGGYVIKSSDGGETWSSTANPDTSANSYVNGVVAIPGTDIILAMDDIGCYYTMDLGETWGKIVTPEETAEDYIVSGVFLNEDFGFVFTDGGLVLRFEGQVTDIPKPVVMNYPKELQLLQNYPNPFNPSTRIGFSLPHAQRVTIEIYNALGQCIEVLVDHFMTAGQHEVEFHGNGLSSGIYYYKLSAGDIQQIRKMALIK